MTDDPLDYPQFVQSALKGAMHRALALVAESGLPGDHHFYISFRTTHPEVRLPPRLREQYPEKMTIVLQHQFHGLAVDEIGFVVALSFDGLLVEGIAVPFDAVTAFADPSAGFALRFDPADAPEAAPEAAPGALEADRPPDKAPAAEEEGDATVVAVDFARRGRRQDS